MVLWFEIKGRIYVATGVLEGGLFPVDSMEQAPNCFARTLAFSLEDETKLLISEIFLIHQYWLIKLVSYSHKKSYIASFSENIESI